MKHVVRQEATVTRCQKRDEAPNVCFAKPVLTHPPSSQAVSGAGTFVLFSIPGRRSCCWGPRSRKVGFVVSHVLPRLSEVIPLHNWACAVDNVVPTFAGAACVALVSGLRGITPPSNVPDSSTVSASCTIMLISSRTSDLPALPCLCLLACFLCFPILRLPSIVNSTSEKCLLLCVTNISFSSSHLSVCDA